MRGYNKVIIAGHVGSDPEIRSMPSGDKIATMSIATSDKWRDKQSGEMREKTEWHRVNVRVDGLVKLVENYVKKGDPVLVEGKLETRKWTDQAGNDRWSTEISVTAFGGSIVMLPKAKDGDEERGPATERKPDLDDDIPF